jgi:hypothetical protein
VAAADGTVARVALGRTAGRYIVIEHLDGWRSYYLHLNNDTSGTDDGLANDPVPGIEVGSRVRAGDLLDYVGDSGNAEETPSHLHFELHSPDGTAINPTPHLRAAQLPTTDSPHPTGTKGPVAAQPPTYVASGTELVGRLDPGGGFAAGVAVNGDTAFMGTWGRPALCPGSGVRVIDVTDPAQPAVLGRVAAGDEYPGTSTDSVWVGPVETEAFSGDLAVVAVRLCDTSERGRWRDGFRGIALYDVTDPAAPELMSTIHSGNRTQGANEVNAAQRPDGTFIVTATVMQSFLHTKGAIGDFRVIDATDPRNPEQVADWDVRADPSLALKNPASQIDPIDLHVHSAWLAEDGMTAWLALWDGGMAMLDLANPAAPLLLGHIPVAEGEGAGNAHTVSFDPSSGLLIRSDEELEPGAGDAETPRWGGQTLYDAADPRRPSVLATFDSPRSTIVDAGPAYSGYFSAHEAVIADGIEYVSWYSYGLRIVDLNDPANPEEVGSFIPASVPDPQHYWVTRTGARSFAMTWGVAVDNGLVYLSDMNTGLWIVRYMPTPPVLPREIGDAS